MWNRTDRLRDVAVYFDAAVRLKNGLDVYQPWPEYGVQMTPFRFFYAPPFLLLVRPLAGLDFIGFARVWTILLLGAFWIYAACLSKLSTGRWNWKATLVFGMVIDLALRGYATLSLGQFEPFMWMLFGLALTTRHRAGFLALATLVKIHPVWALLLCLRDGKTRVWKDVALFCLPALVLSFWLVGTHNWAMWWPSTQPIASQGTFNSDNWSLSFLVLRALNWFGILANTGSLPASTKIWLSLGAVAGPLLTAYFARLQSRELRLALVACAAIAFAPLCWTLYFPLFLLPLAVWLGERGGQADTMSSKGAVSMAPESDQGQSSHAEHDRIEGARVIFPRSPLASPRLGKWPRFSPEFVALGRRAIVAVAVFHFLAQLLVWFPIEAARTDHARDVAVYYRAAMRLKNGIDVHQPWPEYGVHLTPSRFFYAPPFLLITRPLAQLSYMNFVHVWMVLIFTAFWIYALCLSRLATGTWNWKVALVFGMVINTLMEGYTALGLGQFEPFMWMLFGLALTTRHRAGWLALATLVKIHPLWSLGLVLVEDRKHAWKSALAFALPVIALSLWLVGTHNWALWWPSTQPVASQGTFHHGNWSLSFFVLRLLSWSGWLRASGTLPVAARAFLTLCAVGAPLAMAFTARHQSRELRLALVASAGVLCAPLCWGFYYPLFLLPLAVWLGERPAQVSGDFCKASKN